MPRLREGDAPAKTASRPTQHFTQPPPRYSEASLVKRMEELGIGRPSTYASTLQTLKDREYVRLEKNRFIPEESGRLVTAFLERFFERYVSYDFTAELEEELDDVSGGRLDWQKVLDDFWRDFKPKTGEVMEQKPSEITAALDEFLAPWLFPPRPTAAIRGCARTAATAGWPARRQVRRVRRLLQLSRLQIHPPFGQGGDAGAERRARAELGDGHPAQDRAASGPMSSSARARSKRASIPKDVPLDDVDAGGRRAAAVAAARDRRPSRDRQADHRLDRPLRPLSRP